ncbi:hypothetical protein C8R47DRAFT_1202374 [Mycena vitilis]|nr:hypothetical protein C8R47DRAFT_1202374 [Mycena vitilis]
MQRRDPGTHGSGTRAVVMRGKAKETGIHGKPACSITSPTEHAPGACGKMTPWMGREMRLLCVRGTRPLKASYGALGQRGSGRGKEGESDEMQKQKSDCTPDQSRNSNPDVAPMLKPPTSPAETDIATTGLRFLAASPVPSHEKKSASAGAMPRARFERATPAEKDSHPWIAAIRASSHPFLHYAGQKAHQGWKSSAPVKINIAGMKSAGKNKRLRTSRYGVMYTEYSSEKVETDALHPAGPIRSRQNAFGVRSTGNTEQKSNERRSRLFDDSQGVAEVACNGQRWAVGQTRSLEEYNLARLRGIVGISMPNRRWA